ncbi:hypothetical protein BR93DRAFT_739162 [Coniochaeta sp. PMI_546]|nr:hypothetical protein BR93DRAFT_739162 [Coniochaeta sp. PMI_546]
MLLIHRADSYTELILAVKSFRAIRLSTIQKGRTACQAMMGMGTSLSLMQATRRLQCRVDGGDASRLWLQCYSTRQDTYRSNTARLPLMTMMMILAVSQHRRILQGQAVQSQHADLSRFSPRCSRRTERTRAPQRSRGSQTPLNGLGMPRPEAGIDESNCRFHVIASRKSRLSTKDPVLEIRGSALPRRLMVLFRSYQQVRRLLN